MIVVEDVSGDRATVVYSPGAGRKRDLSMGFERYTRARLSGDSIVIDRGSSRTIELTLAADGRSMTFSHKMAGQPPLNGTLSRSN
jgi:hypothetical protein